MVIKMAKLINYPILLLFTIIQVIDSLYFFYNGLYLEFGISMQFAIAGIIVMKLDMIRVVKTKSVKWTQKLEQQQ